MPVAVSLLPRQIFDSCKLWGGFVKFSHSVFALPFALVSLLVAASRYGISWQQVVLIIAAVVAARTAAMSFNRLIDREFDAKNPRTRWRELPSGAISVRSAWALACGSSLIFLACSRFLSFECAVLAPIVLAVLFSYSYTKRFTAYSHLILGLSLALAPGGAWFAVSAKLEYLPIPLMAAVLFWVAGFDLLYACQDVEFDRATKLHSIPARFGVAAAFRVAIIFHLFCIACLFYFVYLAALGIAAYVGATLFSIAIYSQYRLVSPNDLERIDLAFFVRNGLAGCLFFVGVLTDWLLT